MDGFWPGPSPKVLKTLQLLWTLSYFADELTLAKPCGAKHCIPLQWRGALPQSISLQSLRPL